jgi:hypothetical protein
MQATKLKPPPPFVSACVCKQTCMKVERMCTCVHALGIDIWACNNCLPLLDLLITGRWQVVLARHTSLEHTEHTKFPSFIGKRAGVALGFAVILSSLQGLYIVGFRV